MPKVTFTQADGSSLPIDADIGLSVMQVAVDNLVPEILGDCGGAATCATCHVYVDSHHVSDLPPASYDETNALMGAMAPIQDNSRLSCQLILTEALDGLVLRVPDEQ